EFQYYNDMRDTYYTAELSSVWNQALEELANRQDMTEALKSILDREVEKIHKQPQLWENYYLPKLQKFVKQIDNLPEDDLNYPYKDTVVGTSPTSENPRKEGVINRFRSRIQKKVKNIQLLQSKSTAKEENREVRKDEIIDVDIDFDNPQNYHNNQQTSGDDRMEKLKDLVKMKEQGFLTDEQFEAAKKKILGI
ncbi:MAG: SHOCT domain-containing protein, partial [Okeania sp. SIO3B3]|nr:SHOCT domain-containing protein [Okeania sp. SIO3B3]